MIKVPTSALFRRGDQWAVFVLVDGKAAERQVEIGERNGLEAEVESGLAAGDPVIVHPSDAIVDGVEIEERSS